MRQVEKEEVGDGEIDWEEDKDDRKNAKRKKGVNVELKKSSKTKNWS